MQADSLPTEPLGRVATENVKNGLILDELWNKLTDGLNTRDGEKRYHGQRQYMVFTNWVNRLTVVLLTATEVDNVCVCIGYIFHP